MACMRVYTYSIEPTTDELNNTIYKETYTLVDPNKLDDDNDPFDNYKTSYFGTGMKIVLYEDDTCTKVVDSIQGIIIGDLDGDGFIDTSDAVIIKKLLKNKIK